MRPRAFISALLPGGLIFGAALIMAHRPLPRQLEATMEIIPLVILAADRALLRAKRAGRNRLALDGAPAQSRRKR